MSSAYVPSRIARLPIDTKWNLPVPWFVKWINGAPQFPIMDGEKWHRAIKQRRCWICGLPIVGDPMAFVIGPMCGINRTSAEPPSDINCAMYAARTCPFLITPRMKRMEIDIPGTVEAPGVAIKRNPGCCAVWITKRYEVIDAGNGPLIKIGEPQMVHWFAEGRPATRAEVLESIESGLPILRNMAAEESPEALAELARMTEKLERWLPKQ